MPGSGHLMSGQTLYLKLRQGGTIDDLLITLPDGRIAGGLKMANGTNSIRTPGGPFPGTRAKSASLVREQFVKAQEYRDKLRAAGDDASKKPARDLAMEALVEVLDGTRIVHFHTHRHDDIITVLRLAEEFGFRSCCSTCRKAGRSPTRSPRRRVGSIIIIDSPGGKLETVDVAFKTGGVLEKAGVNVGFHTDDCITDSRLFLRSAGMAVRAGMSRDKALYALTMAGARMLELDSRIGTLEAGKDADFIVLSGDPLSVYTHVEQTWVEGAKVFDRSNAEDRKWPPAATARCATRRWIWTATRRDDDRASAECRCMRAVLGAGCCVLVRCCVLRALPASAQVAVRGETVHTMAGAPIQDGVVLVGKDGKIERVGPAASVRIPPATAAAREGRDARAGGRAHRRRPGRLPEPAARSDPAGNLVGDPARAARDRRLQRARDAGGVGARFGVTTMHTGHAPGALVPGQTMIVKTRGDEVEQAVIVPLATVAATLGAEGLAGQGKSPGNRSKAVAMLRAELIKAKDYATSWRGRKTSGRRAT